MPLGKVLLVSPITVKYVFKGFNLIVKVHICETVDISDIVAQSNHSVFKEPWKVLMVW